MEQAINGYFLEVVANSFASARAAEEGGASRIELCQQLEVGGVTPSAGLIQLTVEQLQLGVHVLIRPRAGDFVYSPDEFTEILKDIAFCRSVGCHGIVIGNLLPNGKVDEERTKRMVDAAGTLNVTFHRAFDRSNDPYEALEAVIRCGCQRILTSGLQPNAADGLTLLSELVSLAGKRIEIMPGSGVTENNMLEILRATGAKSIHSSAKVDLQPSYEPRYAGWTKTWITSKEKVRTMADLLKSF